MAFVQFQVENLQFWCFLSCFDPNIGSRLALDASKLQVVFWCVTLRTTGYRRGSLICW